jgi:Protein of unknown function (DUF3987)
LHVAWRAAVTDAPSEYAEALAIAQLAAIAGHRLRIPIRQQARQVPCNFYVCLLGPSTVARKSTEVGAVDFTLNEVAGERVLETPGSPEGFIQDLSHREAGGVLVFDELAWTFSAIKNRSHRKELKGYLLRAYDNAPISRRLRDKRVKGGGVVQDVDSVPDPALTIIAATVPDRLAMVSGRDDVDDGWWPRWAFVWPQVLPPRRPLAAPSEATDRQRAAVLERLRTLDARLRGGAQAILQPEAWDAANRIISDLEALALTEPENDAFFGRAEQRLFIVAALLAFADDTRDRGHVYVETAHVEDASRLIRSWLDGALRFANQIGLNEFEGAIARTLTALKRRGGRAPRRDLARVAHVSKRLMDEIEATLMDRGEIEASGPSKGTATEWRLVDQ